MQSKEELFQEVEEKVYAEILELQTLQNQLLEERHLYYQGSKRDWHKVLRERFGESIYKDLAVKFFGYWLMYDWEEVKPLVGDEYIQLSRSKIGSIAAGIGG